MTYTESQKIEVGWFAPSVTMYASPKSVYGSIDSMMRVTTPVYAWEAVCPSVFCMRFET